MKRILRLTESELTRMVKRMVNEQRSVSELSDAIKIMDQIIDNFDDIDCDGSIREKYIQVYCDNFTDASLDKIERVRQKMLDQMSSSIYNQFRDLE
jgi:hypothetical protein